MKKQIALDFADLRYLEVICSNCNAKTTIDAMSQKSRAPDRCCGCGTLFDQMSVSAPIGRFVEIYRTLTHVEQRVRFRVVVDDPTSGQ